MRIVLAGEGTRGDLQPMIELAARVEAAGHRAVVCGPPDFRDLAAARSVEYVTLGISAAAFLGERADLLARNPVRVLREAFAYVRQSMAERMRALVEIADGADLVIAGGAETAASSAAERCGVAYRYTCYCPVLFPSREHTPPFLNGAERAEWANRLLWPLLLAGVDLAVRRALTPARRSIGLPPVRSPYRHMIGARPLLAADRVLAQLPRDITLAVEQMPALHPLGGDPLPPKLAAFLDAGPAPVYVGFGSMPDTDPKGTTRLVLSAIEQLGVRAILSAGWAQLGGLPLPEGVIEIGAVAHPRLFPRCAAIVHHGGAGTTTNALRAAVPQVVVPHLVDQFYWGRRVRELGIGVMAPRKHRLATADLVAALTAVLDNEVLAQRAKALGAQALGEAERADPVAAILR